MRLGPLTISLQSNGTKPKPPSGEIGATGTGIFGGMLTQQDYNAALQSPQSYNEFEKMRNDGQVKAALTVIKLPLLNADWRIEPASDSDLDREIAERLEHGLKEGMSHSWQTFLRQALLMLDYGSIPFEKVWDIRDGLAMPRKLAPRLPRTVLKWLTDETGGLAGIQQGTSVASGYKLVEIPVDKLLVFVNDLEGSNWRGTSILRSAYKHHYYKDGLYRVQAIALEKRSLGVDVGTLKGDAINQEQKKDLEKAMMGLHAHEKQFFVEVDEQIKYRLETGTGGRLLDPLPAIEHHDLRIVRSMIAEFLAMGAGSTGSLAMHKDKSAYFLMALGGIANNIAETLNKHLIKQWVDYNWRVDEYPRIHYSRLEQRDVGVFAEAVERLVGAGSLTPGPDLEAESRSLLDLPPQMMTEEPEAEEAVRRRQVEKLADVAEKLFESGDMEALLNVSVPYRAAMADLLGDDAEALARASELRALYVREIKRQVEAGEFDRRAIEEL